LLLKKIEAIQSRIDRDFKSGGEIERGNLNHVLGIIIKEISG